MDIQLGRQFHVKKKKKHETSTRNELFTAQMRNFA